MNEQKTALIFPGQGTQYVGMGMDIYHRFPAAMRVYQASRDILGVYKWLMCFNRTFQHLSLRRTDYTQIAIFVTNHAFYQVLMETVPNLKYRATAGHSLGEYNALVASGAISFQDCLPLVQKRGEFMHKVSSKVDGGLYAISGNFDVDLSSRLNELEKDGIYVALINTPRQIVIGGKKKNLEDAVGQLKQMGIRARQVDVEGPFHTPHMREAAKLLKEEIYSKPFNLANVPIVANSSARFIVDPTHIQEELSLQTYSPLKWEESIRRMIEHGITYYVVIGADKDKIIQSMMRQINNKAEVLTVNSVQSLESIARRLSEIN